MSTKKRYFTRQGQAFLIVVIIIAVVISVFTISVSNSIRSSALEGTEIYQREQALYLAEMGVNQMIYNINNGTNYAPPNNPQLPETTVPDVGSYTATYITPDTSGFGGSAVIKGEGTVGQFTRVIYVSLQGAGNNEAYKYSLFTSTGGFTKTHDNSSGIITFINSIYPGYTYNTSSATTPYPDWAWYTNQSNYPTNIFVPLSSTSSSYSLSAYSYNNKVVYINYNKTINPDSNATLTVDFGSNTTYSSVIITIITNYPKVSLIHLGTRSNGSRGWNATWSPISFGTPAITLPLLVHMPSLTASSSISFDLDYQGNNGYTFTLNGLVSSNSAVNFLYGSSWGFLDIKGMVIAKSLTTDWDYLETFDRNGDGRLTTETIFEYTIDYFNNPPPHFIVPTSFIKVLTPSFREEY